MKKKSGKDLSARWAEIEGEIVTGAVQGLFDAGVLVKDTASSIAPKNSGAMAGSYGVKIRHRGKNPSAVIGTSKKYAVYPEFAEDINGHRYGKQLGKPARGLYKALDLKQDEILQLVADSVGHGLDKVGGA